MADADIIVVGAGLAGLVAAAEAADAGRSVIVLDQEGAASLGGQAWWSLGGLFLVNTPEQRHLGVKDSAELALADWLGSAGFDRPEDHWPRQWAQAYVEFAAGEKRAWLKEQGIALFPICSGPSAAATRCRRARQLGAALPSDLGLRARGADPVRPAGHRARPGPAGCSCGSGTGSPS